MAPPTNGERETILNRLRSAIRREHGALSSFDQRIVEAFGGITQRMATDVRYHRGWGPAKEYPLRSREPDRYEYLQLEVDLQPAFGGDTVRLAYNFDHRQPSTGALAALIQSVTALLEEREAGARCVPVTATETVL